jgi:hypothetical protein
MRWPVTKSAIAGSRHGVRKIILYKSIDTMINTRQAADEAYAIVSLRNYSKLF